MTFKDVPLCDVPVPSGAYLQNLKQAPVAASAVRCWHVNEDPLDVCRPCPFDLAVLLETEVYWTATTAKVFEQAFLLRAIKEMRVERPAVLVDAFDVDTVAVSLLTPTGTTLMLCNENFAARLSDAVTRASSRAQGSAKKRKLVTV